MALIASSAITAGGVLLSGKKGSDASKDSARIQAQIAREALAEQRRVYDLESAKEQERYQTERKDKEYDRTKTLADENRVRASRAGAFGGFGGDLATFSKGYAPAYGMSAEQSQGLLDARNQGFSSRGAFAVPDMGSKGIGPGPRPSPPLRMSPSMPTVTDTPWNGPMLQGPNGQATSAGAFGSSVWLQAPTGEVREVPLQAAPQIQQMLQAGAVLIPAPRPQVTGWPNSPN